MSELADMIHDRGVRIANLETELSRLRAELAESQRRCGVAESIVAKLPKTQDGVPVTPGIEVHAVFKSSGHAKCRVLMYLPSKPHHPIAKCYSTEAAARAALAELEKP